MSKVIIFTNENGFASIVYPAEGVSMKEVIKKSIPEGSDYHIVNKEDIPADRSYRNALVVNRGKLRHSMTKARALHMDQIRAKRNARLKELDVAVMKKIEKEEDPFILAELKQRLRDIPENFDLSKAKNTEDLKRLWPDELQ